MMLGREKSRKSCWRAQRKGYAAKRFRQSGATYFYESQAVRCIAGKGTIHPDVAAALAALFSPTARRDVALLVRMTMPQHLPEILADVEIFVANDAFLRYRYTSDAIKKLPFIRSSDETVILDYLCNDTSSGVALVAIGILPPKARLRKEEDPGSVLTLAAHGAFHDAYELVLRQCRSYHASFPSHACELLRGIGNQILKFRFLKSLYRKFPDAVRAAIPFRDRSTWLKMDSDWRTSFWPVEHYLAPICGFGDERYVTILRTLFAVFPSLRISTWELRAAFGNASFSRSFVSQPDPLLRLVCEELPHSSPTLLSDCGRCLLLRVATFVDGDERLRYSSQSSGSFPFHPPPNQFLRPQGTAREGKTMQLFADRVRYLVRDVKVKPDATTLQPIFAKDRVLFNELVTQHNALRNHHDNVAVIIAFWELFLQPCIDDDWHAQLFPVDDVMPVLVSPGKKIRMMADRMRDDIFFSPSTSATRLGRLEKYVTIRSDKDAPDGSRSEAIRSLEDIGGWGRSPNFKGEIYNERSASPRFLHRDITVETIDHIVKYGFDVKMKNSEGNTLLHAAAMNDNFKLFVRLIAKYKLDPMEENNRKQSAWSLVPPNGEIEKAQSERKMIGPNNTLPPLDGDGRRRRNFIQPT